MTLDSFTTFAPVQTTQNAAQIKQPETRKDNHAYNARDDKNYQKPQDNSRADNYADKANKAAQSRVAEQRQDAKKAEEKENFKDILNKKEAADKKQAAEENDIATMFIDGQNLSQEQMSIINNAVQKIALTQNNTQKTTSIETSLDSEAEINIDSIGQLLLLEGKNPDKVSSTLFNLTAEQMGNLQQDIKTAIKGDQSTEENVDFIIVNLTEPATNNANTAEGDELISALPFAKQNAALTGEAQQLQKQQKTANLNNLVQNDQGTGFDDLMDIQSSTDKFSALLKNAAKLRQNAQGDYTAQNNLPAEGQTTNSAQQQAPQTTQKAQAQLQAQQNLTTSAASLAGVDLSGGDFATSLGLDSDTLLNMGLGSTGTPAQQQTANSAQLVNVTAHARHAAQSHPSTTMVSAAINKGVNAKGDTTINLQLDPPELGRVEIRMEFGKDRTLKAQVITEKPEAHLLLQRDSHALERALQDSGLDTENGSLEFVLAEDNQGFSHNGNHDGSRNQAKYGGSEETEEGIIEIESTMTWAVNPETGHTHYSILA